MQKLLLTVIFRLLEFVYTITRKAGVFVDVFAGMGARRTELDSIESKKLARIYWLCVKAVDRQGPTELFERYL